MMSRSLRKLEFPGIIRLLSEQADTAPGRILCERLLPAENMAEAERRLRETDDAVKRLLEYGGLPFSGIQDISSQVGRAGNGAVLNGRDLLQIAALLRAVVRMRQAIPEVWTAAKREAGNEDFPYHAIYNRIEALTPCQKLLQEIENSIAGEEEIFDSASSELMSIRRRIRDAQANIRTELEKVLRKHSSALQEALITVRGDRYVVPVKSEHRSAVPGLIHDSSASGNTVFIEPMSVVQLNNKIRELAAEERHEIERILARLSSAVAEEAAALMQNVQLLTELDFAMAKGKLSLDMRADAPSLNTEGRVVLHQARHPLINKDDVVPIDFELGIDYHSLVITGPNTGGKTVTLKTCGLLTLMAKAGLHIPARSPSEVCFFDQVLADIGDEQSIEQSLSTFSSHMTEIIAITKVAGPGTLVLLDELGAGTDPSEGAALAIAILNALNQSGAYTVATTHYSELKGYAMNTEGVENASCEFDLETLQPTYRLLIGVPGVSHAFSIAQKLGLSEDIIADARQLISEEAARFEQLVSAIETSQKEINDKKSEMDKLQAELEKMRQDLEEEKAEIAREQKKMVAAAEAEAAEIVSSTRKQMDEIIEMLETERNELSLDHRVESELRGRISEAEKKISEGQKKLSSDQTSGEIVVGERYEAIDLSIEGVAKTLPDAKGQVVLESGQISFSVAADRLRPAGKKEKSADRRRSADRSLRGKAARELSTERKMYASTEIMLRGKRADEALQAIDHFIDDAVLNGISPIRLIHGKGTGVLRQVTHDYLMRDPRVKSFRLGAEGEGGDGVTVAELKL
ncbi:MAG: endonuclease MutS2 [Eubacteriales bacterium]|nr:endonuclease MutS2 [Eubacteriales bacterium]MDD4323964.1 endonuclease MutS2 [Eubacteriales bacterium]